MPSPAVAPAAVLATSKLKVGTYLIVHVLGFALHLDTMVSTALAMVVVIGLGLALRRSARPGVPGRLQLFWETVVGAVEHQVEVTMGFTGRRYIPLAVTLFVFILVADWIEIIPSTIRGTAYLPSPTADVNLTYAMGLLVIILANVAAVRAQGWRTYLGHFVKPYKLLLPINVIEELAKPFTLALRLFGNLFAGGLMIALVIALFPAYFFWLPLVIWDTFDMFIGVIQAFIFALLTLIYLEAAVSPQAAH